MTSWLRRCFDWEAPDDDNFLRTEGRERVANANMMREPV